MPAGEKGMAELLGELMREVSRLTVVVDEVRGEEGRLSAELGAALFNNSPDAIVVVDGDAVVKLFNPQAELLFGYHQSEVIGNPVETLLPEPVRERHRGHRDGFLADPRRRPMGYGLRLVGRHKSGTEIPVDINLSPFMSTLGMRVIATVRRSQGGAAAVVEAAPDVPSGGSLPARAPASA